MDFEIQPYIGAGPVKFGKTREEVRETLGGTFKSFQKTPFDAMEADAFPWCHVYYKESGLCEAVEFFEPAVPLFQGESLLARPYQEVLEMFLQVDSDLDVEETGFTSYQFGIGVYSPGATEEPTQPAESVIVFEKGYYD